MIDSKTVEEMARKVAGVIPDSVKQAQHDLEAGIRSVLQSTFARMDLVNRDEFVVQTDVLARTREKVDQLEQQIKLLEERLNSHNA